MNAEFKYDVIVVGAGHAGCEAAYAAATRGAKTCLITMDMNKIAQMSCNPAIGGIAKGQIVREVDALGGLAGLVTDASAIQFRMLNRSKGPAMWSPRAQCDRPSYIVEMRKQLENTPNLYIWQDEVKELIVEEGEVKGVKTVWDVVMHAKAVVITAGTFLNGLMHIGHSQVEGGRCAEPASKFLTESITRHGIRKQRMKTGTPVRIDGRTVHFDEMQTEPGETDFHQFSFIGPKRPLPQLPCWICNTNEKVHEILLSGIEDSPLYNGQIKSIGPRYCPSIETKLVTFAGRPSHHLFLEPEGCKTNELYLNGFSSSLPMDIQLRALHEIPALRDAHIYRPGYAIEYDFFDPTQLSHSLESKLIDGLFMAGQVNGTTGYEEAAGQGFVAGVNAANFCSNNQPLVLSRDQAYIGVLIDDLVTKGVDEPYRMFTSRAEYRILLRQDNADTRLTPIAEKLGTASTKRINIFNQKRKDTDRLVDFCKSFSIKAININSFLENIGSTPLVRGCKLIDIITRPELSIDKLKEGIPQLKAQIEYIEDYKEEVAEAAEIEMKYAGYIQRERLQADKMHRLEQVKIPTGYDFSKINALSTEARQKLMNIQPTTLGQAGRIPGVSPADISALLVLFGR